MLDRNTMRAVALASQLGFAIAGPLLILGGGGFWLGAQLGWGPWLGFVGLLVGLIASGYAIYELAVAIPARRKSEPGQSGQTAIDEGPGDTNSQV